MVLNERKIKEINNESKGVRGTDELPLNLIIGFNGDNIVQMSGACAWHVCKIDEIGAMIKSLEGIRDIIERQTGCVMD